MGINLFKTKQRWRYGAVSTLITALVIVVVILLNVALTALFKRYPLNIDLTVNRIFALSAETKILLASLSDDIGITVLNTEERFTATEPAAYFMQANELLHNYAKHSPRIRLVYRDLLQNPEFSSRYPDLDLGENDILITAGVNTQVLRASDLFNIRASDYGAYIAASRAEQALTSALLSVTSDGHPHLAVVSGHSADEMSAFTDLLRLNAWEITTLNLLTETPPPDVAVILLAGPQRDLSIEELRCLDNFLAAGDTHSFFYLLSPDQVKTPNLDAFLAEWGIVAIDGIVSGTDTAYIVGASPFNTIASYAGEHSADTLPMLPLSHPLSIVFDDERNRVVRTLLRFPPTSVIRRVDGAQIVDANVTASTSSGIPALVLSEYALNGVKSNVLVCGSFLALNQTVLENVNFANSTYFLDLLGTLAGRGEQRVYLQDKTFGYTPLGLTLQEALWIAAVFVALLPIGVIIVGVVVWAQRRRK